MEDEDKDTVIEIDAAGRVVKPKADDAIPVKLESDVKRVTYQCANPNCKEPAADAPGGKRVTRDVLKVAEGEGTPVAVNCWKCGGGRKLSMEQQVQAHKAGQNRDAGMFPLPGLEVVQ